MFANVIIYTFFFVIQPKIGEFKPQKSVLVSPITDKNFNKFIKSHDFVLLLFSASWCSRCEKIFPDFEFAANEVARNEPVIFFGEVMCDERGGKTCEKEDISSFPSLKFYKYGKYSEFFHYFKRENIASFALRYITPKIEVLNTTEEFKSFLNTTTYGVVGFFENDTALKRSYFKVANILFDRFDFAATKSRDVLNYQRITDGIVVYKPWYMKSGFERYYNIYKSQANSEKLRKFLIRNFHGLVGFRRIENEKEFKKPLLIAYYDFDFLKNSDSSMHYRHVILKIAKKYKKSKINFAISHWDEYKEAIVRKFVLYYEKSHPIVTIERDYNKRFLMPDKFSEVNLGKFVENYLNNTLKPIIKSSNITEQDSTILEVTYNTFRSEVIQSKTDVFLEIYDPKCRVSKKVHKPFQEVAEILQDDILFARLDATTNDVPNLVKITSIPTLYYIKKTKTVKTIKFFGPRNVKTFLKFLTKHSTNAKDEL